MLKTFCSSHSAEDKIWLHLVHESVGWTYSSMPIYNQLVFIPPSTTSASTSQRWLIWTKVDHLEYLHWDRPNVQMQRYGCRRSNALCLKSSFSLWKNPHKTKCGKQGKMRSAQSWWESNRICAWHPVLLGASGQLSKSEIFFWQWPRGSDPGGVCYRDMLEFRLKLNFDCWP